MWRRFRKWFTPDHRISRRQARRLARQVGLDKEKARAMVRYYEGERK